MLYSNLGMVLWAVTYLWSWEKSCDLKCGAATATAVCVCCGVANASTRTLKIIGMCKQSPHTPRVVPNDPRVSTKAERAGAAPGAVIVGSRQPALMHYEHDRPQ